MGEDDYDDDYDNDLCSEFDAFRVNDKKTQNVEEINLDDFDANMDKIINHYEQSAQEKNNIKLLQKKKKKKK